MDSNTFHENIRKHVLGYFENTDMDIDIDRFDITKFDYRNIFCNNSKTKISHLEMVIKFFGIDKMSDVDLEPLKSKFYFKDHSHEWKELFIFFCVIPFTEYEFQGKDGSLLNPDTLHNACPSDTTDNLLIGTFSDIEFESLNLEIPDGRLAENLQTILRTNIFSNTFNENHRKILITKLLGVCFKQDYKVVKHIKLTDEDTYKTNFMNYLFSPICEFVASLLYFQIDVRNKNTVGQTGVHTRVPHTTNDLFYSHPDIVAYTENMHCRSLAIVQVKKLPLLKGNKVLDFNDSKMVRFLIQVVAEMFSNHTNKGMLTDSYTTILVEIDIERSLEAIEQTKLLDDKKPLALNYKLIVTLLALH